AGTKLVFTHRANLHADDQTLEISDASLAGDQRELFKYSKGETVVDLAASPDGKWIAMLQLSGPRDARKRQVRVFDVAGAHEWGVDYTAAANFLTWAIDSTRLYFLDTASREV